MIKKLLLIISFIFILFLVSCDNQKIPEPNQPTEDIENPEEIPNEQENIVCVHEWKNGVCTLCGITCSHNFENGICKTCGYKCHHEIFAEGRCIDCDYPIFEDCEHEWHDGYCPICDYYCPHEHLYDGLCALCEKEFSDDCEHEWENGVCKKCTLICRHFFEDSVCQKCGYICTHEGFKCGDVCRFCHYKAEHQVEEGVCVLCGKRMDYTTEIPSQFFGNCPEKGTVEKVVFQSYDYANSRSYENTFFVYLPYGYYDSTEEYNVFYLTHGSGENAAYWLAQLSYAGGYTERTKVVLDNMHYYKKCEPTIVVTPTENLNGTSYFYKELIENIMPLAETLYRTKAHLYGKNVNEVNKQSFIDSRMYRAYAGLSRGSMIGYSIMAYDMAYFGYYGYYSGGSYGLDKHLNDLITTLNDPNNPYKIYYAYHSCGTDDAMYQNHVADYEKLLTTTQHKLVEYENTEFFHKDGFRHNYDAWIVDLYNSLGLRFFKYNDEN